MKYLKDILPATVAIIGVVLIVLYAIHQGINGAVLMSGLTLIGGLGGYQIKKIKDTITTPKEWK